MANGGGFSKTEREREGKYIFCGMMMYMSMRKKMKEKYVLKVYYMDTRYLNCFLGVCFLLLQLRNQNKD